MKFVALTPDAQQHAASQASHKRPIRSHSSLGSTVLLSVVSLFGLAIFPGLGFLAAPTTHINKGGQLRGSTFSTATSDVQVAGKLAKQAVSQVEQPVGNSLFGSIALCSVAVLAASLAQGSISSGISRSTKEELRSKDIRRFASTGFMTEKVQGLDEASVPQSGSLIHFDDTYRIVRGDTEIPEGARISADRVEPTPSEYGDGTVDGPLAWMSKSTINFDYRVLEVPRGHLLDPSCDALLFGHLPADSPERKEAMMKPQRRLVVMDEAVYRLYGDKVAAYFEANGVEHDIVHFNLVEDEKSMDQVLEIAGAMKKFNIDRRTEPVIGIGGGVALDIVGLAASLFRRRTPYIRVPTTTLSYVDAAVGAKSGVNYKGSKNILGMYVPPAAALLDSMFFATESHRRVANGISEMAKMAIMKSPELFTLLEDHAERLIADKFVEQEKADAVPARVLRLSIETMLEELAPNLWENSLDRLVDFGHAIGQGLEMKSLGTEHELMHGEAVAVDMAFMSVLANVLGLVKDTERDRILNMLRGCQVPVHNPLFTREWMHGAIAGREKFSCGQRLPLPVGIGKARIVNDVTSEQLDKAFDLWVSLTAKSD